MRPSMVTVTDLFCGAGGSSQGAAQAGAEIRMALNHWELAIRTHNTNFPQTDHHCCDANQADPRYYPATTVLIASPECTNHSLAKGKGRARYQADLFGKQLIDPSEERSRATMWDVPRFTEVHRYALVIVENVVDARAWVLWESWLHAMHALGYEHQAVYLNSMVCWPTPQSRDRLYVVFWRRGNRAPDLDIRPACRCERCGDVAGRQTWKRPGRAWGRYGPRGQYVYTCPECGAVVQPYYYPALMAIDWGLPIQRIGDRARPLQEKTLARIRLGLERFKDQWLVMETNFGHATNNRSRPVAEPWPTQTGQQSLALVRPPFLAALRTHSTPRGLDEPLQTVVTDNQHFLIDPALIVQLRNHQSAQGIGEPLSTVTAGGTHHGLLMPFILGQHTPRGEGAGVVRPLTGPLPTMPATVGHQLVVPFVASYYRTGDLSGVDEPLPTVPTRDHHALVAAPFIASQYGGDKRNAVHSVGEPLMTVPGMAVHHLAVPGAAPAVEDCGFRMLEPHEIGAAMAFPAEYVVLGNKRERIKQFGNAVTPPVLRLLMERCLASLDGK